MATSDDVIINLLLQEKGIAEGINSAGNLDKKLTMLIATIEQLQERTGLGWQEVVSGLRAYNLEVDKALAKGGPTSYLQKIDPTSIGKIPDISAAQQAAAAQEAINQKRIRDEGQIAAFQQMADEQRMGRIVAMAEQEDAARQKKIRDEGQVAAFQQMADEQRMGKLQLQAIEENKINTILAARKAELLAISRLAPADQIKPLANILNTEMTGGLQNVAALTKGMEQQFGILPETIKKSTKEVYDMRNGILNTAKEAFNLKSIMNTAFGVGMAMIIFQLQQLVTKFFTDTIQQVNDLQTAISKLSVVEIEMSNSGIAVTGQQLLNIIAELEKRWVNISNIDMLKATGDMGIRLAELGVSSKQLKDLMDVALSYQVKNPGRTLPEISQLVTQYAITGEKEGIKAFGIAPTDKDIQRMGVALGFIQDTTQEMTNQEKVYTRIQILHEKELSTREEILSMQDNLANSGNKLEKSWKNLLETAAPLVDIWNMLLLFLSYALEGMSLFVRLWNDAEKPTGAVQKIIYEYVQALKTEISFLTIGFQKAYEFAAKLYEITTGKKLSDQITSTEKLAQQDTPTGPALTDDNADDTNKNAEKIRKALESLFEAMDEFGDRARKMNEDFALRMKRMTEDWTTESARFMQDWQIDRANIIAQGNDDASEAEDEYQQDVLDKEAKFQEKLRQLKEQYLYNLEDALHARDARQVLRLMREYNMDKQNLINEHALDVAQDAAQHEADMARKKKQVADRLALLDAERALKFKRMQEDEKLKEERAKYDHMVEMARLEHEKNDKLRQLANSIADQLKLTDTGAKALVNLYKKYFGSGGILSDINKFMYENTSVYVEAMMKQILKLVATYTDAAKTIASTVDPYKMEKTPGNKKSGSTNTNLSPSSGMPKDFSSNAASAAYNATGANINVVVTLNPDLEGRIISQSVDRVTASIIKVRKGR